MHEKSQTAFREFHQFFNFILNSVIDNILASLSNMTNYFSVRINQRELSSVSFFTLGLLKRPMYPYFS